MEVKGDASEAEIEKEILKKFKMKGLVLGDADVVRLMDNKLSTGSSDIISAGLKKTVVLVRVQVLPVNKSLTSCKNTYTIRLKISGKTLQKALLILLLTKGNKAACTFCNFKSVCQFDESLEDNQFRTLKDMKDSEAMEKIREEVGGE